MFGSKLLSKLPVWATVFIVLSLFMIGHAVYHDRCRPWARIFLESDKKNENAFKIYLVHNRGAYVPKEEPLFWLPREKAKTKYGTIFESDKKTAHFDLHVFEPCEIVIHLSGSDTEDSMGRKLNPKVTYTSLKIDGSETLDTPKTVWYDNSFSHTLPLKKAGLVKIDVVWERATE